MAKNFEILCPCCESTIIVDRISGEVLLHKEKERKNATSIEDMVEQMSAKKSEAEKRFAKELESQKDRSRVLEEKFKEAMQRVDKNAKNINPMDLD
ncbi:MAG TPA: 2-nitropropane dioxygenase [Thermoanaerobaculia bacterium]